MIGLAYMCQRLSEARVGTRGLLASEFYNPNEPASEKGPVDRERAHFGGYRASAEYYAIIDRLSRGERP